MRSDKGEDKLYSLLEEVLNNFAKLKCSSKRVSNTIITSNKKCKGTREIQKNKENYYSCNKIFL